jgi:hypothetical protein
VAFYDEIFLRHQRQLFLHALHGGAVAAAGTGLLSSVPEGKGDGAWKNIWTIYFKVFSFESAAMMPTRTIE